MTEERMKKIETRRATIYLHQTTDGMLHSYALLKFGRYVDRTVEGYEGYDMAAARANANRLWRLYR